MPRWPIFPCPSFAASSWAVPPSTSPPKTQQTPHTSFPIIRWWMPRWPIFPCPSFAASSWAVARSTSQPKTQESRCSNGGARRISLRSPRGGGTVDTAHGGAAAAVEVTLTDAGTSDPLTGALPGTFQALVGHKESTSVLPNSAVLLATSVGCPVQIYRVGSHVYATQFPPEVSPEEFIARSRVYRNHGYFRADELSAVIERLTAASVTEPQRLLRRFAEAALQDVPD